MRKDILIKRVKAEAKNLKKYATDKELSKLVFGTLNPNSRSSCIYGQMTGLCNSKRAEDLIIKCCDKVYKSHSAWDAFENLRLNGKMKQGFRENRWQLDHVSPIEVFIIQDENKKVNNKILINYLKGKTKTLNFK